MSRGHSTQGLNSVIPWIIGFIGVTLFLILGLWVASIFYDATPDGPLKIGIPFLPTIIELLLPDPSELLILALLGLFAVLGVGGVAAYFLFDSPPKGRM